MKRSISRRRVSSSGARSKAEGRTCRERARRERKRDEPAAVSGHPKSLSEQGLRRGRAERHDDLRFDPTLISAPSQGKQASISTAPGLL